MNESVFVQFAMSLLSRITVRLVPVYLFKYLDFYKIAKR